MRGVVSELGLRGVPHACTGIVNLVQQEIDMPLPEAYESSTYYVNFTFSYFLKHAPGVLNLYFVLFGTGNIHWKFWKKKRPWRGYG